MACAKAVPATKVNSKPSSGLAAQQMKEIKATVRLQQIGGSYLIPF